MIRYPYDRAQVEQAITQIDRNWLQHAVDRTDRLKALGRYQEASSIWSRVKPVFMQLQNNKCIFCEQRFEGGPYGPISWDLEHFRPKSSVAVWPDPGRHPHLNYDGLGPVSETGYYWLAYELWNYAASCKVCNTIFKLNYFPVSVRRAEPGCSLAELQAEEALLCYPFGEHDDDPEDLFTFVLTTAVPKHAEGRQALRGQVIIDFFGLNKRDNLHRERALMIGAAGALLADRDRGVETPQAAAVLARLQQPHIPHAACVRAFLTLWDDNPATARRGYEACRNYAFDPTAAPPNL